MFSQIYIRCCLLVIVFCALVNTNSTRHTHLIMPPDILDSIAEKPRFESFDCALNDHMLFSEGFDPKSPKKAKGVVDAKIRPWPNGIIPYEIAVTISSADQSTILNAMQTLMYDVATRIPGQTSRRPCITFRPREEQDTSYLKISYGTGCYADVGYRNHRESTMKLNDPGCFYSGTIQHELMHVLGFLHEHSRPDRDPYVAIITRNISPSYLHNFDKLRWDVGALNLNTFYDVESIMHYARTAYSMNNEPTIIAKKSNVTLGQKEKLSPIDIVEVRRYYGCE